MIWSDSVQFLITIISEDGSNIKLKHQTSSNFKGKRSVVTKIFHATNPR